MSSDDVAAFVASFGTRVDFGEGWAFGWGEPLHLGVVFHDWEPERRRIEISAAATNGHVLTRTRAREIFGWAFGFCDLVYARSDVPVVHRIFRALGGEIHETPVWTICTLTAAQWKEARV
jgi:hypothetical protein